MKKLFSTRYSDNSIGFALLVLRLTMGILIIPFGYQKLMHFAGMSSKFVNPFHLGPSISMALVIFAELFCGALIVMGLLTRFAAFVLTISMSVALIVGHKGDVFGDGGHAALFLGGFITILFAGPGKISLDKLISK